MWGGGSRALLVIEEGREEPYESLSSERPAVVALSRGSTVALLFSPTPQYINLAEQNKEYCTPFLLTEQNT